jgi:hypothetical protein
MIPTRTVLAVLIGVNVLLGSALAVRKGTGLFERQARAQIGGVPIIQVVGGQVNAVGTIFILNQTSGDLVVLQPDANKKREVVIDKFNVNTDLQAIK